MIKSELKIGEIYVADLIDRVELLEDLGYGDWKIRYLDPPNTGIEASITSGRINRPWVPTASHLKTRRGYSWANCSTGEEHEARLKETAIQLAEQLEADNPHAIREIDWELPRDEYDPQARGLINLSLPESMAEQVLAALKAQNPQEASQLGELLG